MCIRYPAKVFLVSMSPSTQHSKVVTFGGFLFFPSFFFFYIFIIEISSCTIDIVENGTIRKHVVHDDGSMWKNGEENGPDRP